MKGFIFDENLPSRLKFAPSLPVISSAAIRPRATDSEVWDFAKIRELAILNKDSDFSDRIIVSQPPPWVVHLRFGNVRRREFHELLARVWPQVEELLKTHKFVNVYADRIEAIG